MLSSIVFLIGIFGFEEQNKSVIPIATPIKGYDISSSYGYRTHPVTGKRRSMHKGIDISSPKGTPIYATADGVISYSGRMGSYGKYIEIQHGNKITTRYAHMSKLKVDKNSEVEKGDVIGYVGTTGRSTGPHLHYEIRIEGEAINPEPFLIEK